VINGPDLSLESQNLADVGRFEVRGILTHAL